MKATKLSLPIALLAVISVGCAQFSTVQTDRRTSPDGTLTEITTEATAKTLWASKTALANWKATQSEDSQGAEVGGLDQEVEGAAELGELIGAAVAAYQKLQAGGL